jgi:hypothetical protein
MRALLSHVSFGRLDNVMIKQYIVVAEAPADRKRLAAISN